MSQPILGLIGTVTVMNLIIGMEMKNALSFLTIVQLKITVGV